MERKKKVKEESVHVMMNEEKWIPTIYIIEKNYIDQSVCYRKQHC